MHILIFIHCSVTTDAEKMLEKLGSVCKVPEPELEKYVYLQVFSREDESMYRVKVTEERVTSTFHLSAIWTPRSLMSTSYLFWKVQYHCTYLSTLSVEILQNEKVSP